MTEGHKAPPGKLGDPPPARPNRDGSRNIRRAVGEDAAARVFAAMLHADYGTEQAAMAVRDFARLLDEEI